MMWERIMSRENHVSQSMTYKLRRIPLADLEQGIQFNISGSFRQGKTPGAWIIQCRNRLAARQVRVVKVPSSGARTPHHGCWQFPSLSADPLELFRSERLSL
jgi:hypothetical protein